MTYREYMRAARRTYLKNLIAVCNGNQLRAAQTAGLHRSHLQRLLAASGIHAVGGQQNKRVRNCELVCE